MVDQLPSQVPIPTPTPSPTQQTIISTVNPAGRLVKAITDQLFFHIIPAGITYQLFDDSADAGALIGFEISCDLPDVILQIYYYADNPTVVTYVNNFQMHELLSLGRGLTPGDVQVLPNLQTQDIPGRPSNIYPYLARFKLDKVPDFTAQFVSNANFNSSSPVIVLRFEPAVPVAYKRIVGNIINTNSTIDATIITMDIKREIFQDIPPGEQPPATPANQPNYNVRRTVALPSYNSKPAYGFTPPVKKSSPDDIQYES